MEKENAVLTEAELLAMRELCDAATSGPWRWRCWGNEQILAADYGSRWIMLSGAYSRDEHGVLVPMAEGQPVADFIAAARSFVPRAIATIETLKAKLSFTDGDRLANELPGD
jgi:hypothetical protein